MRIEFSFSEFIRRMLPVHKRQSNRIALHTWTMTELSNLWTSFVTFRENAVFESNSTGQTISLEALLNRNVTGSNNSIYIKQGNDGGLFLSTDTENSDFVWLSLEIEATDSVFIPLDGEVSTALAVNFEVYIPNTANKAQVTEIVNRYVVAGYTYNIIQS